VSFVDPLAGAVLSLSHTTLTYVSGVVAVDGRRIYPTVIILLPRLQYHIQAELDNPQSHCAVPPEQKINIRCAHDLNYKAELTRVASVLRLVLRRLG
jgi:hypothetical protein